MAKTRKIVRDGGRSHAGDQRRSGGYDEWIAIAEEQARIRGIRIAPRTYRILEQSAQEVEQVLQKEPGQRTRAAEDLRRFIDRIADLLEEEGSLTATPNHWTLAKKKCGCFPWCYIGGQPGVGEHERKT